MSETALNPAAAPRRPLLTRAAFHGSVAAAFAAVTGVLLVWPRWIALEGSREATAVQRQREAELTERVETERAMLGRQREWSETGRRVLLSRELNQYPEVVRAVAEREGARVLGIRVLEKAHPRWRALAASADMWAGDGESAGQVRPITLRFAVVGRFDSVYRVVASLADDQWLFIPDRWELAPRRVPAAGKPAAARPAAEPEIRADIAATLFALRDSEPPTPAPTPGSTLGEVAAAYPVEMHP